MAGGLSDEVAALQKQFAAADGDEERRREIASALELSMRRVIEECVEKFLPVHAAMYQCHLAVMLSTQGRTRDAVEAYKQALVYRPRERKFTETVENAIDFLEGRLTPIRTASDRLGMPMTAIRAQFTVLKTQDGEFMRTEQVEAELQRMENKLAAQVPVLAVDGGKLLTPREAAKIMRVQLSTVHNYIKAGRLEGVKNANGRWMVSVAAVETYQANRRPSGRKGKPQKEESDEPRDRTAFDDTEDKLWKIQASLRVVQRSINRVSRRSLPPSWLEMCKVSLGLLGLVRDTMSRVLEMEVETPETEEGSDDA